jgi:hypothetical protein
MTPLSPRITVRTVLSFTTTSVSDAPSLPLPLTLESETLTWTSPKEEVAAHDCHVREFLILELVIYAIKA